ncbi:MAG TPA: OmpA family protein [Stellaceae bacterium]|nr:OmpA family protein [Stellaceae bacterium]
MASFRPRLAIGWQHLRIVALLTLAGVGLAGTPALAQRSAVTVDQDVLDALGPIDSKAQPGSRLRLHLPVPPAQQRPAPSAGAKSAPIQANSQPSAAANPPPPATTPQAAPAKQASLPPSATTIPSAPTTPATAAEPQSVPAAAQATTPPVAERILFQPDEANLADDAKQELDRLAARLGADGRLYVQLVAYASGSGGDASQARRLSLSRALAARSYLVDHGVEIKQIDVRPLGNKSEPGASPDRIDLVVTQR